MSARATVDPWVRGWWRGEAGAPGALLSGATLPLEAAYRAAVAARRRGYDSGLLRRWRAPVPVVSVGNVTVGGTGKTPVTGWIVRRLHERGERPAVLLRGYGADEERLHRRWSPDVPVLVDADRVRAASRAASEGATALVLDDGFQHRRLARDLDVVLVAAEQRLPGRMLPRGPYREPPTALARADLVLVTRRTASDEDVQATLRSAQRLAGRGTPVAVVRLAPSGWTDLDGAPAEPPAGALLAVSGVADPAPFARMAAETAGGPVELLAFPDHHAFDAGDARRIRDAAGGRAVVVTEKDAVKLAPLAAALPSVRVLTLEVRPEEGAEHLETALARVGAAAERPGARPW